MNDNQPLEIVIVGLGASGLYASKSTLSYNRKCHVTIIEKRNFDQFSPCGFPKSGVLIVLPHDKLPLKKNMKYILSFGLMP